MAKTLVIASVAWPLLLAGAVWANVGTGGKNWTAVVYLAASRICHQRPERSFHTAGVQWPVCARCSGLYLAAPISAVAAAASLRRRRRRGVSAVGLVALAAAPTILTIVLEWFDLAPVSNIVRAVAALPLGAAIAFILVRTAAPVVP